MFNFYTSRHEKHHCLFISDAAKKQDGKKWRIKYYKGLGTSSAQEAREYFGKLKMNQYIHTELTDQSMNLAFSKLEADNRKDWLKQYDMNVILDHTVEHVPIPDFINKELIHFSNSDTFRSIGSVLDGLKPSQRKIMFACMKRNLYKEIKVAQLSGYVSEISAYHHGEMSLQSTIVGLAQTFVGSNNINLLKPNGQFGTRIMGGSDSASARYIHTELSGAVPYIFRKEDMPILQYNEDDGVQVEPMYYVPIIPLVLVNGMNGIGTGFSTTIPQYNPLECIKNIKRKLEGLPYMESELFSEITETWGRDIFRATLAEFITNEKPDFPYKKIEYNDLQKNFYRLSSVDYSTYIHPVEQQKKEVLEKYDDYKYSYEKYGLGLINGANLMNFLIQLCAPHQ